MKIICKRCGKKWDYKGKKKPNEKYPVYISCPRCKTTIKLTIEKEK